jgi:IS1 family transposase
MNKLPLKTRVQILSMLVEGSSMRSISRVTGVSINTVTKLLEGAGAACAAYHDENVVGVKARLVQCDEIWSFLYAKNKNVPTAKAAPDGAGDVWTWTALDSESKMILAYEVGDRSAATAIEFMDDLRRRIVNRVQLTTDGHKAYLEAVEGAFGADVDYAMLVKLYGEPTGQKGHERKYSPAECTGALYKRIEGNPDLAFVSTSHVERHNLTMRMGMRRFTRLTNGFSKKVENLAHAVSLHYQFYNFARVHTTLKTTPAMAAGVANHKWSLREIAALLEGPVSEGN